MHSLFSKRGVVLAGLLAVALGAMAPSVASAKPAPGAKSRGFRLFARSLGAITVNRVYCGLSSTGEVCVDSTNSSTIGGGFWPKGTADQYIFNSGLQIAGKIQGGPWNGDITGAFLFDPKGTTQHGEEVRPIFNTQNPADAATINATGSDCDITCQAAKVSDADALKDIFDPLLRGRAAASQGDVWWLTWDGNPSLNAGRPHPLGIMVEQRGMGWNYPSGNEDILYFAYTFYNVTSTVPADYASVRPGMRDILLQKAQEFQDKNNAAFNITLPQGGYTITDMYAAFAADMDVGSAGANASSVNLPFALGYTYEVTFGQEPGWTFDPSIFGKPFFSGVGFGGVKYLKSPTGPGAIQLFSNTINSATGFRDAANVGQLYRYLSGTVNTAAGDANCNFGPAAATRVCFVSQSAVDARFFQSSTALTLAPGEFKTIVVAYIFAPPVAIGSFTPNGSTQILPSDPLATNTPLKLTTPGGVGKIDSLTGYRGWSDANADGIPQQNEFSVVPGSLLGKSLVAQAIFDNGFLLPFAPTTPDFFLVPGDNQVTVLWRPSVSETEGDPFFAIAQQPTVTRTVITVDPITGDTTTTTVTEANSLYDPNYRKLDVEGYRIYRGRVDSPNQMELIAQFDYAGTTISDFGGQINPVENCAPELGLTTGCPVAFDPVTAGVARTVSTEYPLVGNVIQVKIAPGGTPARQLLASGVALITQADTAVVGLANHGSCAPNACPPLSDTGVPFVYVDKNVRNNFRYFYSVTAFDLNSFQSGPSNLESPRQTKPVVPQANASNSVNGALSFGLFGDDGTKLDPNAPELQIDAATGKFTNSPPPTNSVSAIFAPFVPAISPSVNLQATIDSVVTQVRDDGTALTPICGGQFNGLDTCTVFYVTFNKSGSESKFVVPTVAPVWSSFDGVTSVEAGLGAFPIEVDPASAARFGMPTADLRSANAAVGTTLWQSIDFSSHEGQAARRGRWTQTVPPCNGATACNNGGAASVGGSRWFQGAQETVDHPTVGIRAGHLPGVDTILNPQPWVDVNPADGVPTLSAGSADAQWFTYGFAQLSRQADVQFTWAADGSVTVRDVTHHVNVPFSGRAGANYGFVTDADGDGKISVRDFEYIPNVCDYVVNENGTPACTDPIAQGKALVNKAAVTDVSTDFTANATAKTTTGKGFGLYINGERYVFQLTGGALPAAGTVWTLRTYSGRVDASTNTYSATPSGYRFRPAGARSAVIPGLQIKFIVDQAQQSVAATKADLEKVHTVPDPYYVTNEFEQATENKVLRFVNLPAKAIIRIYSSSGVLVNIIEHNNAAGSAQAPNLGSTESWNLRNRNNQVVASGVYFYHIESGDARRVGRFTVVNFAQ